MDRFTDLARYGFSGVFAWCLLALLVMPGTALSAGIPDINDTPDIGSDGFASHLPVLVLEFNGDRTAGLTVYDNGTGRNSLRDSPRAVLTVTVHDEPKGEPEPGQAASGKKSRMLTLLSQGGGPRKVSLIGLPDDNGWRLQGSVRDKGMLRNGLAYELGRAVFPGRAPETRYCEVLFREGGRYRYQGIHILAERMERVLASPDSGLDEAILLEYTPGAVSGSASGPAGDEAVFGLTLRDRGFRTLHPEAGLNLTEESGLEMAVDALETALHSLQPAVFLEYRSLADQDSFIDLYILNSLLLQARESRVSFLLARDRKGRLTVMPRWDFDNALDNTPVRARPLAFEEDAPFIEPVPMLARRVPVWRQLEGGRSISSVRLYPVYEVMDGGSFLWFDRLFLSRPFLLGLFFRYHELRRGPLSPRNVGLRADELAERLGPALARDWQRWETEYTAAAGPLALAPAVAADGEAVIRQTGSLPEEMVKVRYLLRGQNDFLMSQATRLDWLSIDLFDEAATGNNRAGIAFLILAGFLFLTHMLTRKL